jgi:hypothetical protein
MNENKAPRPPFKVQGYATIKHLNVRKEGLTDEDIAVIYEQHHNQYGELPEATVKGESK